MIKNFFEQLAGYYRQENDLSNIVVALCNSNPEFKEKFIKFFFPNILISNIESILREVPDQKNFGSRVDIFINMLTENKPYIIEVKIGDRNHHFGQYEEAYEIDKERFGYITNYDCIEGKELGYDVKTWEGFYEYLNDNESDDDMIKAFALYLKNVCGIIKYERPMNITGLDAIPCFVDTVRKIISKERSWVKTSFYHEYPYNSSVHEGFIINFPDTEDGGYAIFGLWFREKPIISIAINARSWLSDRIMEDKKNVVEKTNISKQPYQWHYWDKKDVWFELSDEKMQNFIDASSYEDQQEILEEFFEEVLKCIKKYF